VTLEFFRSHFGTGFGWYLLGQTQHDFLPIIQIADFGSAYAVTILVAAVNGLVFELLFSWRPFRRFFALAEPTAPRLSRILQTGIVVVMIGGSLAYGLWRLNETTFEKGPRIALVQSNLDLRLKISAWGSEPEAKNAAEALCLHQVRLTDVAAAAKPELIVWPETSWPDRWLMEEDEQTGELRPLVFSEEIADFSARRWRAPVLFGMNTAIHRPGRTAPQQYNSAVLMQADASYGGRYDKMHCVPFGEYVPLRWVPFIEQLSPYDFDYSITPGEQFTRFPLGKYHFGVVICYEDTVTELAPEYSLPAGDRPSVDFLLNTSNDGWFAGTPEHEQHLAIARFRAIESRRSLGRAVNMGVSAVIDPNGRVLTPQEKETVRDVNDPNRDVHVWEVPENATDLPTNHWHEFKTVPGVLYATMPIDHRTTIYARYGDWLAWSCSGLLGILLVLAIFLPRFSRMKQSPV
jgi:apolipoprotein N-acyltransferase